MRKNLFTMTPREQTIWRLIATGDTDKEIALDLGISVNTVRTHVKRVFSKAGVNTRTRAALAYLISCPDPRAFINANI